MKRRLAVLVAGLLATPAMALQADPPADEPPPRPEAPEPAPPAGVSGAPPTFERRLGLEEIAASLERLAARHPDRVLLEELGVSAGGVPIPLVVLGDRRVGDPRSRPALLLAPEGGAAGHGAELGLALAWRLAEAAAVDPAVAARLLVQSVFVLPLPDPDGREGLRGPDGSGGSHAAAGTPAFGASFPLGWLPERLRPGGGAVPLDDPAARAAHGLLEAHQNLVLFVSVTAAAPPGPQRLWAGAALPPEDARAFASLVELAGEPALVPWPQLTRGGGGFLDHAYQARGVFPVAFVEPAGLEPGAAVAAWIEETGTRVLGLLARLPRLELELAGAERLGPGLWQIDVDLRNAGTLPTASVLARRRAGAPGAELTVQGATVVAHARRGAGEPTFEVAAHGAEAAGARFEEPPLAGGEVRRLRFVVETSAPAEPGSLRLEARAPWSPPAQLEVVLPEVR